MRILFDNLLISAALSAIGESLNYPINNLKHAFLKKKFQQVITGISDANAPTMIWSTDQTIDMVVIGYTNGISFTLKLYDSINTVLYTNTFTCLTMGAVFTPISGVRKARLLISDGFGYDPTTIYAGGIGLGLSISMPNIINDWRHGFIDNSFGESSLDGQVLGQYIEPLRSYVYNFITTDYNKFMEIQELIKSIGKYTPIWIVPFELALSEVLPFYAILPNGMESMKKENNKFSFSLTFQEAR